MRLLFRFSLVSAGRTSLGLSLAAVLACGGQLPAVREGRAVVVVHERGADGKVPPVKDLGFVRVDNGRLQRKGQPYHFVGTNLWYGAHLGAVAPDGQAAGAGDRTRLVRELDRLKRLGVTNLRVLAGSEGPKGAPWRIEPAMQEAPGSYREEILEGLDFLLAEMAKRDMQAVLFLTNFWYWSGGMAQYVSWSEGSEIPYPPEKGESWESFSRYAAKFYEDERAQAFFRAHLEKIVNRTNTVTGVSYRDDTAIMAWELANEPRGADRPKAMRRWIDETACLIKGLDPNHLVTTGSEGDTSSPEKAGTSFLEDHASDCIDYMTFHLWVENWGWYTPEEGESSYDDALRYATHYIERHAQMAVQLGKPAVLEEFGIARDKGSRRADGSTANRNAYFSSVMQTVYRNASEGGALAGLNFWAWSGEAEPVAVKSERPEGQIEAVPPKAMQEQPLSGDPPHETPGWYGILADDEETLEVIKTYASLMQP